MAGIFSINTDPLKIIAKYAKKDFAGHKVSSDSYTDIQNCIVQILKKKKDYELKELLLETEMRIQHIELYDFNAFMGTRLAFYSLVLAIMAVIFTNTQLLKQTHLSLEQFLSFIMAFLIFVLVSSRYTEDKQKEEITYRKFLIRCINLILKKETNEGS